MDHSPYTPPVEAAPAVADVDQRPVRPVRFRVLEVASALSALGFVAWAILLANGVSTFLMVILGLIAAPYLVLWLASRSLTSWSGLVAIAVTLGGCAWFGIYAFDEVDEDAQGAINLVVAPMYQIGGVLCMMCLALALDWIERRVVGAAVVKNSGP